MMNHSRSSIRNVPLEDEGSSLESVRLNKTDFFIDVDFKNAIDCHIDYQRSFYPQQHGISHSVVGVPVTTETGSKKPPNKRTISTPSIQPKFMKLEGRTRLSNISKLPQLRILKRDIRRRYLEMYYNVSNSHDINLYSRFLHEFCTPNCQSVVFFPSCKGPIVRSGIEDILQDTVRKQAMLPDGVLRYAETKIYVPLETPGSRIVATVSFRGTKLFDVLTSHEDQAFMNNNSFSSSSTSSSSSSISDDTETSNNKVPLKTDSHGLSEDYTPNSNPLFSFNAVRLSPTSAPAVLDVNAVFTIHLDASNRIERFVADSLSVTRHKVPLNSCI